MDTNRVIDMLRMQDKSNSSVNPNWRYVGNDWLLAILMESAEAINHFGWKWWKHQKPGWKWWEHQKPDMNQVRMGLVDIWRFALSHFIETTPEPIEQSAFKLWSGIELYPFVISPDREQINLIPIYKQLIAGLSEGVFSLSTFAMLLNYSGMTWDDLYCLYMAKNILIDFQRKHEYKEGTYQKIWDGREDIEHLTELLGQCTSGVEGLEQKLEERYASTQK